MTRPYSVPLTEIRREQMVLNSKFIATLAPAFSIDEARAFMARIRKEFSDASHNVPVYIIGGGNTVTEYFSDDGEPAGTSGKPALAVLQGSGLGDAALVKAYTESAQLVVNAVEHGSSLHPILIQSEGIFPRLSRIRQRLAARDLCSHGLQRDIRQIAERSQSQRVHADGDVASDVVMRRPHVIVAPVETVCGDGL